jgi:hypothetical protein
MLVIVHSGQTGVERGAHRAAVTLGISVAGFMPIDKRDELGPVPPDVADLLTPCFERGPRPAVRANVAVASGVLVIVPDATRTEKFTAMAAVLQAIRAARIPFMAVDANTNLDDIVAWVKRLPETSGSTRVMVTGPRGTRWPEGEGVARRVITSIAMT